MDRLSKIKAILHKYVSIKDIELGIATEIVNIEEKVDAVDTRVTKDITDIRQIALDTQKMEGVKGETGDNGTNGVNGINGTDGKDGTNGTKGIDGKNGDNGEDGLDGLDGKDGSPDTGEQVIEKIETFKDDELVFKSDLKKIKPQVVPVSHGGVNALKVNNAIEVHKINLSSSDFAVTNSGHEVDVSIKPDTYVPYTGATANVDLGAYSLTTPLLIGGTSTTADLSLKTTSGVGATGADMHFLVGNNGATEAMTILNSGNVGIGTTAPGAKLHVRGTTVPNKYTDLYAANGFIVEDTEGRMQFIAANSGTGGAGIVLTNAPASGNNTNWNINHVGSGIGTGLLFRYSETTASGQDSYVLQDLLMLYI